MDMDDWLALFDGQTRYTLAIHDSPSRPTSCASPAGWTIAQADIAPE